MGNTFANKPTAYSGDSTRARTYDGDMMATYKQTSSDADSWEFGNTRMQVGVKMIQDIDPGKHQGDMYVVTPANKRLYFTHQGQLAPYAQQYISQGKNFGNGPAISITGNPLHPSYHMFYAKGGDEHDKGDEWTPIQINSKADIMNAVTSYEGSTHTGTEGKYANMYGDASINPFGQKEGDDMWTGAAQFGTAVGGVIGAVALPLSEMALDDIVPFASTVLNVTGANKALQSGINSLVAHSAPPPAETSNIDPNLANIIKDPRLGGYLTQLQDQSQQFIAKYGSSDYVQTKKLAQDTAQQRLLKGRQLAQENENLYVQGQVQELQDTSSKLQEIFKDSKLSPENAAIFRQIHNGLSLAQNNNAKLNVINHFSKQIKNDLLPLLQNQTPAAATPQNSEPQVPPDLNPRTASAQVNHPVLSINGTDSRHPAQNVIYSNYGAAAAAGAAM